MTETTIQALAAAGASSVHARPYLVEEVLAAHHRRRLRRRSGTLALAGLLFVGGTIAARTVGHSRYVAVYEPSGSMGSTIATGETLIADRTLTPTYGDVVAMEITQDGSSYQSIRRVIGLPGDTIACPAAPDGRCHAWTRNGSALDEPYTQGDDSKVVAPVTVGPGIIYVLGDQRDNAMDSRLWPDPVHVLDVFAVGVEVHSVGGRSRAVAGAPAHEGPGQSNVDPAQQPTANTAPVVTEPDGPVPSTSR